jgi:menaquinone-9 beta-reductase
VRFDVVVIGSGPAGAIAALVLARGGASVALVDKAGFPREKACGDLIGPRGVQALADLGVALPNVPKVGDMLVVGAAGRQVRLPCVDGLTYPGYGVAVPRSVFDADVRAAALEAGAVGFTARAEDPLFRGERIVGFTLSTGLELRGDFVIGADGATSRVATAAGLVEADRVLWGFAIRSYLPQSVDLPVIALWEPEPRRAFPGYGWVFPGEESTANVGLGLGTLSDRQAGQRAARALPAFVEHMCSLGILDGPPPPLPRRLGGWLKMGMVGTTPAAGSVLLVGDACGLVNPLQGEGISQALTSGRAAADAILGSGGSAAEVYTRSLATQHIPYYRITAALQRAMLGHPRMLADFSRLLIAAGSRDLIAGGWALFWNELADGAPAGRHSKVASAATGIGRALTSVSATAAWFRSHGFEVPRSSSRRLRPDR